MFALATRLTDRLAEAGRTEWAREEFAALANLTPNEKRSGPDEFRRIKGSAKLSLRKQAVLRELYVWREERAAAADRPPFKIIGPDVLLTLADKSPTTIEEVEEVLASYPRQASQFDAVLDAIERGLDLPESELPKREVGEHTRVPAAARRRVEALRAWRDEQAKRSQLEPSIVMSQKLIDRVALAGPQTTAELVAIEGLRRWRVVEWGPALLAACK